MEKRKTKTSTEVKARYNAKTYRRFTLNLREDADADIIAKIESHQAKGESPSDAIKALIRN